MHHCAPCPEHVEGQAKQSAKTTTFIYAPPPKDEGSGPVVSDVSVQRECREGANSADFVFFIRVIRLFVPFALESHHFPVEVYANLPKVLPGTNAKQMTHHLLFTPHSAPL
jgi:hypothetical protein